MSRDILAFIDQLSWESSCPSPDIPPRRSNKEIVILVLSFFHLRVDDGEYIVNPNASRSLTLYLSTFRADLTLVSAFVRSCFSLITLLVASLFDSYITPKTRIYNLV